MLTDFLISCSGANKQILKECSFEKIKYIGIGLTNVLIAILSSVSVGFFISFAFTDKETGRLEIDWYYLLTICAIWGLLIFNLDRSIIISIRKTGTRNQQFMQALPRILIAVFIGIVISTPLELKIFADEIKVQMEKNLKDDIGQMKRANLQTHDAALTKADLFATEQERILRQKEKRRNDLYESFIGEAEGTSGTGRRGAGPVFKQKKAEYDLAESQYKTQYGIYKEAMSRRDSIVSRIGATDANDEKIVNDVNGPAEQIVALYQLPGVHWFVTILFILLETMPVIIKLMSKRGVYDEILERNEMEIRLKEDVVKADKISKKDYAIKEIDEVNGLESELRLTRDRHRIAAEMQSIDKTSFTIKPAEPKPSVKSEEKKPASEEPVPDKNKKPVDPVIPEKETQKKPEESTASAATPVNGIIKEPVNQLSFENKTWKDQHAAGNVEYRFIQAEDFKKLIKVANDLEKTGSWEYDPNQKLLVMNIDGNHREYKIISETPTSLHLQSLMGKSLHLIVN